MGRDDQKEEREVLDSIFPDEITDIDETSFRVSIALDIPDADEESPPPPLLLTVTYPESYPDVGPHLDLSLPPNSAPIPNLSLADDKAALLSSLDEPIQENLGMAMVFTLVSTLKENAEALLAERRGAAEREIEQAAAAREARENEKFHGTAVTKESFMKWRDDFRKEAAQRVEKEREEKEAEGARRKVAAAAQKEDKMTGRLLWEKGLAGKAGEEDDEDEDAQDALKGVEKLSVKA